MDTMLNVTRNDINNEEEDLLSYWHKMVEAWRLLPDEYARLIQYFNNELHTDFLPYAPLQIVGDFWGRSDKILVVTEKPKIELTQKYRNFENLERGFATVPGKREGFTWVNQLLFALNYFKLLRKNDVSIEYYTKLEELIHFYEKQENKIHPKYELLQRKVIQIHLIPFYAKTYQLMKLMQ